jgi:multidrug resistance efflux pump
MADKIEKILAGPTIHGRSTKTMRRKNSRVVIVGFVLMILAVGFYFFMLSIASQSTDPVALMQTVGTVAGAVVGISLVMIILGLIGKKV